MNFIERLRPRYRAAILWLIFTYFCGLLFVLLTRESAPLPLVPVWWITISGKKLLCASFVSLALAIVFLILSRSKLHSAVIIIMLFAIPFVSYGDFFNQRGGTYYQESKDTITAANNPFLNEGGDIRAIKKKSANTRDLWDGLCARYDLDCAPAAGSERQSATDAMLIVSAFFDYGNKGRKNVFEPGCVVQSEESNFEVRPYNFKNFQKSDIGCCTDFAYALASFLNHMGIENQFVNIPDHIANRAKIDGKWVYMDANANVMMDDAFDKPGHRNLRITYFPHPNVSDKSARYNIYNFQRKVIGWFHDRVHFVMNNITYSETSDVERFFQ